ncbi:TetR/AcrR family transcriptional regulator [Altererythrobacter arenosus]|uniref:TetR/AcrR family transcriptional regulator n=1 Tax=Altererythrobacter arenosus TaxID=3032592 RepID=A0ABY8FSK0_9SPHN|nr:TetR/AcrR family transcriptional regulator [Altererythrobacter sp. CAU 1644]WFL77737.1 TetR/AcrR family transcriptional regulator [Altererythrobacter sp. CAU 1644]
MAGLREKSKKRRRETILTSSRSLFRERGYTKTTIDDIAAEAEVSIGTIYSYFGSKGGIFLALVQSMISEMQVKTSRIAADPPEDPVDAIAAMYEACRFSDEWRELKLWDAFRSGNLGPSSVEGDPAIDAIRNEFEVFIYSQFEELLNKLVASRRIRESVNIDDAKFILFHFLLAHFNEFIRSNGKMPYERMIVDLHRRLRTLFLMGQPVTNSR